MEKHRISFTGVETGWHNALPLGNGRIDAEGLIAHEGLAGELEQYALVLDV